jgi:hypothetical protein
MQLGGELVGVAHNDDAALEIVAKRRRQATETLIDFRARRLANE